MIVSAQEWVTLDLRSLHDPRVAAQRAIDAWHDAETI